MCESDSRWRGEVSNRVPITTPGAKSAAHRAEGLESSTFSPQSTRCECLLGRVGGTRPRERVCGRRGQRAGRENRGLIMHRCSRPLAGVLSLAILVGAGFAAQPAAAREIVAFKEGAAGSIIIKSNERRLYYVLGNGRAVCYPVGVGRAGKRWSGTTFITGKYRRPDWSPPREVKRDQPRMQNG